MWFIRSAAIVTLDVTGSVTCGSLVGFDISDLLLWQDIWIYWYSDKGIGGLFGVWSNSDCVGVEKLIERERWWWWLSLLVSSSSACKKFILSLFLSKEMISSCTEG